MSEFLKVIEEQKREVRLLLDIEELEAKVAPDGGETVVGLGLPKKPRR